MKALATPLFKAIGVALIVAATFWLLEQAIDVPKWLSISSSIASLILTGVISVQQSMNLGTYFRAIAAYLTNAPYLYELDIRISASSTVNINALVALIEDVYRNRASLGIRGTNYLQIRFLEPPRTVEIRIQPDVAYLAYQADEGVAVDDHYEVPKMISIDLVDPVELRYRDSEGKVVHDTFDVLQDLANDIARIAGGRPPYFTVTINRVRKGVRPKHPSGPGPSGIIQDMPDVRIRRDTKALQLQSSSSSAIVKHLTQEIAALEPVA